MTIQELWRASRIQLRQKKSPRTRSLLPSIRCRGPSRRRRAERFLRRRAGRGRLFSTFCVTRRGSRPGRRQVKRTWSSRTALLRHCTTRTAVGSRTHQNFPPHREVFEEYMYSTLSKIRHLLAAKLCHDGAEGGRCISEVEAQVIRKALMYVGVPSDAAAAIAVRLRQALRNSLLRQIRSAALKAAAAAAPKFPPHLVDFVSFGLDSEDVSERHAILASGYEAILYSKASWTLQGTQFRWTDKVSGPLYEYDTIICRSEGSAAAVVRGAATLPAVIKITIPDGDLCPWHITAHTKYHIAALEAARRARKPEQKILILGASKTAVDKNPVIRKAAQNLGTVVLSECREVASGTLREHEKPQGAALTLSHEVIQPATWQTEINNEEDVEAENGASNEDVNRTDELMSRWEDLVSSSEEGLLRKIRSSARNAFAST